MILSERRLSWMEIYSLNEVYGDLNKEADDCRRPISWIKMQEAEQSGDVGFGLNKKEEYVPKKADGY